MRFPASRYGATIGSRSRQSACASFTPARRRRLTRALRPDFEPWFKFASATGLRLAETLLRGIASIGSPDDNHDRQGRAAGVDADHDGRGGHPRAAERPSRRAVFTYVCRRPKKGQSRASATLSRTRAQIGMAGYARAAGVKGFRFHDVRHDMATKLLRATGNLKLVSRALNHSDVKTTARVCPRLGR